MLGSINDGLLYEDLIGSADVLEVAGVFVHVLSLERLISLKRELGRPKDLTAKELTVTLSDDYSAISLASTRPLSPFTTYVPAVCGVKRKVVALVFAPASTGAVTS